MEILFKSADTLFGMFLLLCFSAFFSGSETALFSLDRHKLAEIKDEDSSTGNALLSLLKEPSKLLVSVLFGNMVVNVLFFSLSAVLASQIAAKHGAVYQAVVGLVALVLVIIFGEILPKAIGVAKPLLVARATAFPLIFWEKASAPFRIILHWLTSFVEPKTVHHDDVRQITADELKMLLNKGTGAGRINLQAGEMVEDIVELSDLKIRNLIVPRVEVIQVPITAKVGETMQLAREHGVHFVPVYDQNEDDIRGIVSARQLFVEAEPDDTVSDFVKPLSFVPETKKAGQLLDEMITYETTMAAVVDEYGGFEGIVTLSDLLGEVVGEFEDDRIEEEEEEIKLLSDNRFQVLGRLSITHWKDFFEDDQLDSGEKRFNVTTLSGFVIALLEHFPVKGDVVRFQNLLLTVNEMSGRRIKSVIVTIEGGETL